MSTKQFLHSYKSYFFPIGLVFGVGEALILIIFLYVRAPGELHLAPAVASSAFFILIIGPAFSYFYSTILQRIKKGKGPGRAE